MNIMTCKLRYWIFNKKTWTPLAYFSSKIRSLHLRKLTSRWTQRWFYQRFFYKSLIWSQHGNHSGFTSPSKHLGRSPQAYTWRLQLRFILRKFYSNDIATWKKKRRLRSDFYTSRNGHELCSSYNLKYQDRLRKHLISSSTSVYQGKWRFVDSAHQFWRLHDFLRMSRLKRIQL
jgi:hypothetical protein